MMINGAIQDEDITPIDIYAPNIGAPQHIKKKLTDKNGEIDGNTITVGDFSTPLTSLDRSFRQKINTAREKKKTQ